jgi:YHS domain-containing protein
MPELPSALGGRPKAAGTLTYGGREYHFCSLECVSASTTEPERFVDAAAQEESGA